MKRNLDQVMTGLDGEEFEDKATLKQLCFGALSAPLDDDPRMPIDKKMKQYGLIQKVHKGGEVDLTAEEIALIKERAAKAFKNIIVFGRLVDALESEPKLEAVKGSAA